MNSVNTTNGFKVIGRDEISVIVKNGEFCEVQGTIVGFIPSVAYDSSSMKTMDGVCLKLLVDDVVKVTVPYIKKEGSYCELSR